MRTPLTLDRRVLRARRLRPRSVARGARGRTSGRPRAAGSRQPAWARPGRARALRRDDVGRLAPGARADAIVLNAPTHHHLMYRPGVPLVAATILRGEPKRWG